MIHSYCDDFNIDKLTPEIKVVAERRTPLDTMWEKKDLSSRVPSICANTLPFFTLIFTIAAFVALPLWIIVGCSLQYSPFDSMSHSSRSGLTAAMAVLLGVVVCWIIYTLRFVCIGGLPCTIPTPPPIGYTFVQPSHVIPSDTLTNGVESTDGEPKVRKVYVIANFKSGSGDNTRDIVNTAIHHFNQAQVTVTLLPTFYPAHARDYAYSLPFDGYDALCVVGGDGSIMEVVNGLLKRPDGRQLPVGLLPGGSGNSYAADVGCWDIEASVSRIVSGQTVTCDTNYITDSASNLAIHSINVMAWGLIGDVAVTAEQCRCMGPARYDVCGFWALLKNKSKTMKVEYWREHDGSDDVRFDTRDNHASIQCPMTTAFVNHTQYFGKGYRVAPFAQFNDGLMDMTLCQNATRGQLLEVFAQLPIGAHVGRMNTPTSSISQIQIQRCKFSLDDGGGVITIDGDVFAYQGDLTIQCKKHAFRIFAPQNAQALPNPKAYVVTYK